MGLISAIVSTALGKRRIEKIIDCFSKYILNPFYVGKDDFFYEICNMGLKKN